MSSDDREQILRIWQVLEENESFIIFNHMNPDGDAVGSQLALCAVLEKMGKSVCLYSSEKIYEEYAFLPGSDKITTEFPGERSFDVAIMLDCANAERIAERLDIDLSRYKEVVNIDHHASNSRFGTVNWVRPERSSAGELVYTLIREKGLLVDADIATCLYTGMFADTGGFRHSNTSADTLKLAAELVAAGARPAVIARNVCGSFREQRMFLLGKSLGTVRTVAGGRVAYIWIYTEFHDQVGSKIADADEFVEYPRSIKGVDIALAFKETKTNRMARVNLRSNNPKCDVNKIASAFGGGGHAEASACNVEGTREEIERRVLEAAENELRAAYAAAGD